MYILLFCPSFYLQWYFLVKNGISLPLSNQVIYTQNLHRGSSFVDLFFDHGKFRLLCSFLCVHACINYFYTF